jgi:hypothetical protein
MGKNDPPPSRTFDPPEEAVWHRIIAQAAYYRAQKPEFAGESALEHWLAAEEEIRVFLAGGSTAKSAEIKPQVRKPGKVAKKKIAANVPDRK